MKARLAWWRYTVLHRWPHRLFLKAVWRLPRPVVYWAAIRLISHAAVGPYQNQVVPDLTALDALARWEQ